MFCEIIGFKSNFIKVFTPIMLGLKLDPAPPNKREDLLSLMHILSATIKVAGGAGIHDGKIFKRYLWRNTSKQSWLLGKNNFIFFLGDYNLFVTKEGSICFERLLCKNEVYLFIKEYYKRRTKLFLYR
jgi:hypothetical protein